MSAIIAGPDDFARAYDVSRETIDRLETYASLLRQWQTRINLVAPATLETLWQRHMADSAQLLTLAPRSPTWLDLGSGAGFPGLVIAIMGAADGAPSVTLVESDTRKCAFLREVARHCGIAVDIRNARIETVATQDILGPFGVVSARALAPLPRLLELAAPFLGPGSTAVFPKGRDVEQELAEARRTWCLDATLVPSRTEQAARIVLIRGKPSSKEG